MGMTPIQGDPGVITAHADRMISAADRMRRAAATLRKMSTSGEYRSDAVEALRANSVDLEVVMSKAEVRYRGAGDALRDFAPQLDAAQKQVNEAIASEAATNVGEARREDASLGAQLGLQRLNPIATDDERADLESRREAARAEKSRQEGLSAAAWERYHAAVRDHEAAGDVAAARIDNANKASTLNDSFWDNFKSWADNVLSEIAKAIVTVLAAVKSVLDVVSVILAFVPGLQVVAAALKALSVALTVVVIVTMVVQVMIGDRSWGEFLAAGIPMVVGVVKFGRAARAVKLKAAKNGVVPAARENLKKSSKHLYSDLRESHPDYQAGFEKFGGKYGSKFVGSVGGDGAEFAFDLVTDPSGVMIGKGSDALGSYVDSTIPPDQQWSTDNLATHDVGAVGTDSSNVDTGSILNQSFSQNGYQSSSVGVYSAGAE